MAATITPTSCDTLTVSGRKTLHPLAEFIPDPTEVQEGAPTYWYEGRCPDRGIPVRLPRTPLVETIAQALMQHLASRDPHPEEGKMYGVLLVESPRGEPQVLQAFSGLLGGQREVEGWVPPIPGRDQVALQEAQTLESLHQIKQELYTLQQLPERQQYALQAQAFEQELQAMADRHRLRQQQRQSTRQILNATLTGPDLSTALAALDRESQQDGLERRRLKQQRDQALQPLKQTIEAADHQISALKQRRKVLSQALQAQMQATYGLMNFLGQSRSLQQLLPPNTIPSGTGDCCAPKLLHYAATHHLKPLAMAEFWWGPPSLNHDRLPGQFYGACLERCQPLMGFLLSGLPQESAPPSQPSWPGPHDQPPIPAGDHPLVALPSSGWLETAIVYADDDLIVVNKPAGLLSVPGRTGDRQDSVLSRLRHLLPDGAAIMAVHRLDQDTSGLLLLARHPHSHRHLNQQFQQRRVYKVYEALLHGPIVPDQGMIDLPLWGDPQRRPYQQVDHHRGKPSLTRFRVLARRDRLTLVEFIPVTGRTHQIRVHAAIGLGVVILGDRLYGCTASSPRLHLHARELQLVHPRSGQPLHLQSQTPF